MPSSTAQAIITALEPLSPDLYSRAWCSIPHPTLPLLATAHGRAVTVFSLATRTPHSDIRDGHERSVRSVAWKPASGGKEELCLVTGSFDATAGIWRWDEDAEQEAEYEDEMDVAKREKGAEGKDWQFTLVLEGHDAEIKSVAFSTSGQYLATSSRDKSIWIWEDVGDEESPDEWETVAVLNEHDGDVKMVAWCPDVPGRSSVKGAYSPEVLASASYDNTVRIWREDADGEWVCVAVLEGHQDTVWGVHWETHEREDGAFPRLATYSGDGSIRIWKRNQEPDAEAEANQASEPRTAFGGIPNTMRMSLREDWSCEAVLPNAHRKDVYSVTWSTRTGLMASTGSDGGVALYREKEPGQWEVIAKVGNAHGPYEVNHITWCPQYAGQSGKGDEMLVTTGDDGQVRTWEVKVNNV